MNSFWKASVMNFLRDWLVVAEAKKLWTSIVFLIVLDHLLGAFIRGNYQQVIPEWLGSILKRAAFLLSRIYYYKATTQIFDGGRRHKSKFRKLKWISKNFSQFVWLQYSDRQTNFIDAHMVSFSDLYKQFIMFIT